MEEYDVIICGGGIAGSVAAKFAAANGLKTLLVEKHKTPRNKACSGIQFTYLEDLIGEKIPRNKLCTNNLFKVEMITPKDKMLKGQLGMLNFWRSIFDSWLNELAVKAGAEFQDETSLVDFQEDGKWVEVTLSKGKQPETARTRYLVGADGSRSCIRKKLRPADFGKAAGGTLNYYFVGEGDVDMNTLYLVHKREFSPLMFSWIYYKDDKIVIGTGADKDVLHYAQAFFSHVEEKYNLRGKIVRKEGYSSTLKGGIYLGQGNILMAGDAASLVDLYRGMGMDNAALSGRLAIKAIMESEETGNPSIEHYHRLMRRIVAKFENNAKRQAERYSTDENIEKSLSSLNLMKGGLLMMFAVKINKILPPERIITLPL